MSQGHPQIDDADIVPGRVALRPKACIPNILETARPGTLRTAGLFAIEARALANRCSSATRRSPTPIHGLLSEVPPWEHIDHQVARKPEVNPISRRHVSTP